MNMLRNIKFYLSAFAILVSTTSCLDKYPGSSIPEKEAMRTFADAEQTLTGIYASLKSNALYSGYLTLLPDRPTWSMPSKAIPIPTARSGAGTYARPTCSSKRFTPPSTR